MKWAVSGATAVAAVYVLLLVAPYPLFGYQARYDNITVYSDHPIPVAIAPVLIAARDRLRKSPLDRPTLHHRVFICNDAWRFKLFVNYRYRVGGLNYAVLNRNIFLRGANIEHNRLIGASGGEVPGERTLAYFIAHEIGHSLEVDYLGRYAYWRLPEWKREGYADVIGRDGDFDFNAQLTAFRRGDRSMDPQASGLYLRYQLVTTFLMERKGVSPASLLAQPFDVSAVERELQEQK